MQYFGPMSTNWNDKFVKKKKINKKVAIRTDKILPLVKWMEMGEKKKFR